MRLQQRQGIRIDHRRAGQTTLAYILKSRASAIEEKRRLLKGAQSELYRLRHVRRVETKLCAYAMATLTTSQFEDWTAERMEEVTPGPLKCDLMVLRPPSHGSLPNVRFGGLSPGCRPQSACQVRAHREIRVGLADQIHERSA